MKKSISMFLLWSLVIISIVAVHGTAYAGDDGDRATIVPPGINKMYMITPTPEQSKPIKDWVREYRKEETREGLKIFSLALNEVI